MENHLPGQVEVNGATIRFGVSGAGPSDLLLVHGNGAHHMWWKPVATILEDSFRLITLDLSGHGESSYREVYTPDHWSDEVLSVLDAVGSSRPTYVGHSMGGRLALRFASRFPERVAGLVVFDASVRPPERYRVHRGELSQRPQRIYDTWQDARDRFRLLPVQPPLPGSIIDPIAEYSIHEVDGGFGWKHDQRSLLKFVDAEVNAEAHGLTVPLVYAYGGQSTIIDDELAQYVASTVPTLEKMIRIEDGHHHVILDHPEECARIIVDSAAAFAARLASPDEDLARR